MSRPHGTYKLKADQCARVYAAYTATRRGRKFRKLMDLSRELGVCTRTLERLVIRERRRHLANITERFTATDKNFSGASP